MNAEDDIIKAVADFMKGKIGYPDMEVAELLIKGEVPPYMFKSAKLSATYGEFEDEYSTIASSLSRYSLEHCLAILGSMFTLPELQSNAYRLEVFVHLAFLNAKGEELPTQAQMANCFNQLDRGTCGRQEDPAEDVFLSKVTTKFDNYRLFEGSAESNSFHTQLFLSILEDMPANDFHGSLKETVTSVLKLSDEIAERTGIPVYCVGNTTPESSIKRFPEHLWPELRKRVTFTFDEIKRMGINSNSLEPFLIEPDGAENLRACRPGDSPLDFKPIYRTSNGLVVFQPSLIGTAIRYFLITSFIAANLEEDLHKALVNAYAAHFANEGLFLRLLAPPLDFQRCSGFYASNVIKEIDRGRYLHLLFFVDGFKGFENGGFIGMNQIEEISEYAKKSIDHAQKICSVREGFREGLTLAVSCGWGRNIALGFDENSAGWRATMISARDVMTLNHTPSFQSLDTLRVLDAEDALSSFNIELMNVNGFLNLFAWINDNDGHIFPHEKMSRDLPDGRGFFSIPSNCNLKLRHAAYVAADIRTLPRPDGSIAKLRRMHGTPRFGTKELSPFYVDIAAIKDRMFRSVYIGKRGIYWIEAKTPIEFDNKTRYQLADMIMVWGELVFQYFDGREHTNDNIRVSCCFHFLGQEMLHVNDIKPSDEEISMLVEQGHRDSSGTIVFNVKKAFFSASQRPDNLAERAVVKGIVESCFEALAETPSIDQVNSTVNAVVKTDTARHFHVFSGTLPHDFIREDLPEKTQIIERIDDANTRLGLGWLCRNPSEGGDIEGLKECREYLAKLLDALIEKYKTDIAQFNRQALVKQLIRNHEIALYETNRWNRTYVSVMALSDDKTLANDNALQDIRHYNAASMFSRIAIEAAICECPLDGGLKPGNYDISRLLSSASMIYHIGLYPAAMNTGMMEHVIKISLAGEVMVNQDFSDEIVQPYGEFIQTKLLKDAAQKYPENYVMRGNITTESEPEEEPSNFDLQSFKQTWYGEYGFRLENLQTFIDGIYALLEKNRKALLQIKKSELIASLCNEIDISPETAAACIEAFSYIPRDKWNASPEGYMKSAWYPWRFRRQLSLISRPIVQLENTDDSDYLIAPAMIIHFITKFVSDAGQGALDSRMFRKGGPMCKWIGKVNKAQGEEFNKKVADKFQSAGWSAKANLLAKRILRKKNSEFGDVDVLAWDRVEKRVLVIECKNLLFDKTPGEIAGRLANFRGVTKDDGERDDLKKHLDRYEYIKINIEHLSKFVGFDVEHIEGVLMFSKPTPVQFSKIAEEFSITLCTFDKIEKMFRKN